MAREFSRDSRPLAQLLIRPLRERAREHGYALAVHGTLVRDIDLIACPWAEDAVPPCELAESLRQVAEEIHGVAINSDREGASNPAYFDEGCPGLKPHGRLCWSYHLGGGPYIDLSVMPRTDPVFPAAALPNTESVEGRDTKPFPHGWGGGGKHRR